MLQFFSKPAAAPFEISQLLKKHFPLTIEMARQELSHRYSGQAFGLAWAFIHPLVYIGVYIFLFVIVFKMKIGGTSALPLDYTTYLLAGLIPWLNMQEVLNKSPTVIMSHANLVKQVVFPIEVLPMKAVMASLPAFFTSLSIILLYSGIKYHGFFLLTTLLPVAIFFQILFMIGLTFILSSFGVFLRDTKDFIQILSFICMYFMPIFYLPNEVPHLFRPLIYLNPFSYMIWCYQDILYFGEIRHPDAWIVFISLALVTSAFGYRLFNKVKVVFGNVL